MSDLNQGLAEHGKKAVLAPTNFEIVRKALQQSNKHQIESTEVL